jgi:lipoyl(octanoyl) transferase
VTAAVARASAAPHPYAIARTLPIAVRELGVVDYETTWHAMQDYTKRRSPDSEDELWLVQHPPVYTVGIAGRAEHYPRLANGVPVVKVDRGGQITHHGPGQAIAYLLLDLRRRAMGVRALVRLMEAAVIDLLDAQGVQAQGRDDAPGVYVGAAKVAALGLRLRNGCCYHGIALNVDMDLTPFDVIDPCGYRGLAVTQTRDLGIDADVNAMGRALAASLVARLASRVES